MDNTSNSSSTNNTKNRLNIFYFFFLLFFSINHIHKYREVILHSINSKNINKRYEFYAIHNIIVIFLVPTGSSWLLSYCSYISICPCSIKSEVVTIPLCTTLLIRFCWAHVTQYCAFGEMCSGPLLAFCPLSSGHCIFCP